MTIRGAEVKACRELLGWSRSELSERSRVGLLAIAEFEDGVRDLHEGAVIHLRWALQSSGVEFGGGGKFSIRTRAAGGIIPPRSSAARDD